MKRKTNYRWVIKIVLLSMVVSSVFTLASSEILGNAGYIVSFLILAIFILVGIIFDIIGVAVTSASPKPFHSMASHREPGAIEALRLIRNAEKVSSFCNDVVGDIAGIISGTTSAIIAARLMENLSTDNILLQIVISGLVAGITIGGKAVGKTLAINHSTEIVHTVGKLLTIRLNLAFKRRG